MLRLFALACVLALSTTVQADQTTAQTPQHTLSQDSALSQKADDMKLTDDLKLDLQKAIKEEEREVIMQQAALKWIDGHPEDANNFFKDLETEHPELFSMSDASEDSKFEAQQFGWGGPGFGRWGGGWGRGGWGGWGRGGGWGRRW